MSINELKYLTLTYHLAKFGSSWSSAIGDIKYSICHVNSQNHAVERLYNFIEGVWSFYAITLPSLVGIGTVVVETWCVYFATLSRKTMWLKGHITTWIEASQNKSSPYQLS